LFSLYIFLNAIQSTAGGNIFIEYVEKQKRAKNEYWINRQKMVEQKELNHPFNEWLNYA
jgi:hypothetical protein